MGEFRRRWPPLIPDGDAFIVEGGRRAASALFLSDPSLLRGSFRNTDTPIKGEKQDQCVLCALRGERVEIVEIVRTCVPFLIMFFAKSPLVTVPSPTFARRVNAYEGFVCAPQRPGV